MLYELQIKRTPRDASHLGEGQTMASPAVWARVANAVIDNDPREHVLALLIDGSGDLVGIHTVAIGIADSTLAHPRETFRAAIMANACSLVLAHNHPSGVLRPSGPDDEVTQTMALAGNVLGIPLHDHIIVTGDPASSLFFSYRQSSGL